MKVFGLFAKAKTPGEHGLPKHPIEEAFVSFGGVIGDYNHYRYTKKKGAPEQALLLMPYEMISELCQEGWPINPGDFGENITTKGIAYNSMQPGTRYRIGEVECEISKACTPCKNLYLLEYVGNNPAFLKTTLNRRGWYAKVLKEGKIRVGDSIEQITSSE